MVINEKSKDPEYKRMRQLAAAIDAYNESYYKRNSPLISDDKYDILYYELMQLERNHYNWVDYRSPIEHVGSDLTEGFKKYKHKTPIMSIQNAMNMDELQHWLDKVYGQVSNIGETGGILAEYKVDGFSLIVNYKNGIMVSAATRGDGEIGDDVTQNAKMISNLPLYLPKSVDMTLRGEVYMDKEIFDELNTEGNYKNARNLASGTIKLHDPMEVMYRRLKFMAFEVIERKDTKGTVVKPECAEKDISYLSSMGFKTTTIMRMTDNIKFSVDALIRRVVEHRDAMPFCIDGIVFKVNRYSDRPKFKSTTKYHNWEVAYKFQQAIILTNLEGVEVQVGRTGVLTPVAIISPTEILGTTVRRATLHNYSQIKKLDISVGDEVILEKGGEIIPKIISVHSKAKNGKPIHPPSVCPICGSNVFTEDGYVDIFCANFECASRLLGRVNRLVYRGAFDIKGFGVSIAKGLIDTGAIKRCEDVFKLTKEDLMKVDKVGDRLAEKLLKEIDKAKVVKFDRFIYALGIKGSGKTVSKVMAKTFDSVQNMLAYVRFCQNASRDDYMAHDKTKVLLQSGSVGEVMLKSILDSFNEYGNDLARSLLAHQVEVIVETPVNLRKGEHKYEGKSFVITGTLTKPRADIVEYIESQGGKVVGSVSKNTDYLLVGENPGSKFNKAMKIGTTILTEKEL